MKEQDAKLATLVIRINKSIGHTNDIRITLEEAHHIASQLTQHHGFDETNVMVALVIIFAPTFRQNRYLTHESMTPQQARELITQVLAEYHIAEEKNKHTRQEQ